METAVIRGAAEQIRRHRPLLHVENDRREGSAALIGLIGSLGYRAFWHLAPLYNPSNFHRDPDNVFPGVVSINLFCVPVESAVHVEGLRQVRGADDWWE